MRSGLAFGYASKMVSVVSLLVKSIESGNAGDGMDFFAYSRNIPRADIMMVQARSVAKRLDLHVVLRSSLFPNHYQKHIVSGTIIHTQHFAERRPRNAVSAPQLLT